MRACSNSNAWTAVTKSHRQVFRVAIISQPILSDCLFVSNRVRVSLRFLHARCVTEASGTIEAAFGTEEQPSVWNSASDASVATWLRAHAEAAAEGGLPIVLRHSDKARSLQQDILDWLNSVPPSSAVSCVYSKFVPRPWTVTASSLKLLTAVQFVNNVTQTANAEHAVADAAPLPYHEEFGRLLDTLFKTSIKAASAPDSIKHASEFQKASHANALPGEWRAAEAAFTPLTICPWQFGDLLACEETDALLGRHIVELKTMERVDVERGAGGAAAHGDAGKPLGDILSDHVRQMAVSLMALHVRSPARFSF